MFTELDERAVFALVALGLLLLLLVLVRVTRGVGKLPAKVIPLGGGHRLQVVELEGRRLLIGTGPSGPPQLLTELAELPAWTHNEVHGDGQVPHGP
ncbi:flagellar biosynthetic protein FliO [Nannocystis sp.]|uniref:flagellar biosynthetic protein FliO n=1 Tax=Nannocystis sp. TaxID=1962667 RepID=UPI0024296076|nr:flagellar biosynthetic protein FliO [Nannocystis sp.]MBK7829099.1 flagellar biosynthetic protein FliO [Nannocystis sp.]MBK9754791.1 flagellar biosynthetic protein FliO [Nannocystis sp.]